MYDNNVQLFDEWNEPLFDLMDPDMAEFHIRNNTEYAADAYKSLGLQVADD
jgi:hypothetical protein